MSIFNIKVPNNTKSMTWSSNFRGNMSSNLDRKQAYIDSECMRLMYPLVPFKSGTLARSTSLHTVVGSGVINQYTPYARYQYYNHKSKSYWFETMKNRHKDQILKGAEKI